MSITYDYYRIFYYVAKYQSFTRAAEVLMNNQPNISRAITNLEHELGCQLFIRSNRGVTLTPEGQKLYSRVAVAHRQLQAAEEELADAKNLARGVVTVGVSEIALHLVLLPKLQDFRQRFPDIRIRISSTTTPQALTALRSGLVDFAMVTTPTGVSHPFREIILQPLHELLVGGPRFASLAERVLTPQDLLRYPLILMNSQTNSHSYYLHYYLSQGVSLRPEIEVSAADQILPMVKSNLGIGILPDLFAKEALERKEIFRLSLSCGIPPRSVCLVTDTSHPVNIAARELERMLISPVKGK